MRNEGKTHYSHVLAVKKKHKGVTYVARMQSFKLRV